VSHDWKDTDDHWGERERDFAAKPTRTTIKWTTRAWIVVIVIVGLALVLGAGVWLLRVATSDVKGQGDAEIIKNDARNRIRAQEGFEQLYQDVVAADKNVNLTAEALKLDPASVKLKTELNGQRQFCNDLVGKYNAKARSFTQEEFRAADLPLELATTDPAVDCKENAK
jgi:hypothetical protein